jgi:hypothetical protein
MTDTTSVISKVVKTLEELNTLNFTINEDQKIEINEDDISFNLYNLTNELKSNLKILDLVGDRIRLLKTKQDLEKIKDTLIKVKNWGAIGHVRHRTDETINYKVKLEPKQLNMINSYKIDAIVETIDFIDELLNNEISINETNVESEDHTIFTNAQIFNLLDKLGLFQTDYFKSIVLIKDKQKLLSKILKSRQPTARDVWEGKGRNVMSDEQKAAVDKLLQGIRQQK